MNDGNKTKNQLLKELQEAHRRIAELSSSLKGGEILRKVHKKQPGKKHVASPDFHPQKPIELLFYKSTLQYQKIFDSIDAAIHIVDRDMRFVFFNRYFEKWVKILGLPVPEDGFIGKSLFEVFQFLPDSVSEEMKRIFKKGSALLTEEKNIIGGREFIVEVRKIPLFIKNEVTGVLTIVNDITRRKKMASDLRASEQRYRLLAESAQDYIFIIDKDLRITYANKFALKKFGFSVKEMVGKHLSSLFPPDNFERQKRNLERVFNSGKALSVESMINFPQGNTWQDTRLIPLKDAAGETYAIMGLSRDISKRKLAERTIKSRLNFEKTISTISARFFSTKEIDKAIKASLSDMGSLIGASRAHLFQLQEDQKSWLISHEWRAPGVSTKIHDLNKYSVDMFPWWMNYLKNNFVVHIRDSLKMPKGRGKVRALLESQGIKSLLVLPLSIEEALAGFIDFDNVEKVTEWTDEEVSLLRICAEIISSGIERERYQKKMDRLAGAITTSTEGIAITDENDRYIYVNDAFARIHGYTKEELLGKTWKNLIPEEVISSGEKIIRETLHNTAVGKFSAGEYALVKDGSLIPTEVRAKAIWDEKGRYKGHICVITDITERKLDEDQLREAKHRLEEQNEELKKLDQTKDGLIKVVSHELKAPVAKYSMQIEILKKIIREKKADGELDKVLAAMESSVKRQQEVIYNILNIERLEAGGRKYIKRNFRLDLLIKSILEEYGDNIVKAGIAVKSRLLPVSLCSDREMLRHVFSNIISNAVKFSAASPQPFISIRLKVRGKDTLTSVSDNGIGLDNEELGRVFEKFFKAVPSYEGSGIGLCIAKKIVEDLEGRIWIESPGLGEGATVHVLLPSATKAA